MCSKNPLTLVAFHEITIHKDKRISVSHLKLLKAECLCTKLGGLLQNSYK